MPELHNKRVPGNSAARLQPVDSDVGHKPVGAAHGGNDDILHACSGHNRVLDNVHGRRLPEKHQH